MRMPSPQPSPASGRGRVLRYAGRLPRATCGSRAESIADILEEPFGGDLFAEAFFFRQFVDLAGDGEELRPLDIAALGIGDLPRRGPAGLLAAEQIGVWQFPDERPLLPQEIIEAGDGLGALRHSAILWPLVLTQQALVWQAKT